LRLAEGAKRTGDLLHVLDVDCIARHPLGSEREVSDAQRPTGAINGRSHHPLDRLAALGSAARHLSGRQPAAFLDKLDLALHHAIGAGGRHGRDIGGVDQPQLVVVPPEPHRDGGGFDEANERRKILPRPGGLPAQLRQFAFAFGEIEHPDQCRAGGRDSRICEGSTERKPAPRAWGSDREGKGGCRALRPSDRLDQVCHLIRG
jgi:hypothetical protein